MNMFCSVCGGDRELKVTDSRMIRNARFISCATCRERSFEPRALIVLGAIYPEGSEKNAKRAIKYRLYEGEEITANEII